LKTSVEKLNHSINELGQTVTGLRKEAATFSSENLKLQQCVHSFQEENKKLCAFTDSMSAENENLKKNVKELNNSVDDLMGVKIMIEQFAKQSNTDLSAIIYSMKETLDKQTSVLEQQKQAVLKSKNAVVQQETVLLYQVNTQISFMDKQVGLSEKEFSLFLNMLPVGIRNRSVLQKGFAAFDHNNDGTVDPTEFKALVQQVVDEHEKAATAL